MSVGLQSAARSPEEQRYRIAEKLAVGGMAEVFLAHLAGPARFDKEVVIKRLKPQLAADERLVELFHDEARVTALLRHPHTVHVFDSGNQQGLPFIAMERIEGEELNVLCRQGLECGEFLPLEHAVELIRQAALGMGYFHNLRDADGEELHLVHCDISPNNLLVSRDGYLQIIDFGIGQSRGQSPRHQQLVPGKLSYMSPEQARREHLDRRSDIFSLGVILYEITLGRRLFRGPAREVLERIIEGKIPPPTFVRQDYPGPLESIVMRALEPMASDRFQDAYDLADALGEYLREERMRTGVVGVARYLDRLAVARGSQRREELISEAELAGEEDALDFDRGRFSGFEVAAEADPETMDAWDDFDEDEELVAEALGIDVSLVRTAARASLARESRGRGAAPAPTRPESKNRSHSPKPMQRRGSGSFDEGGEAPEPAGGALASRADSTGTARGSVPVEQSGRSAAAQAWLWMLLGLILGAGGALAVDALG